jgi:hypothetical protein
MLLVVVDNEDRQRLHELVDAVVACRTHRTRPQSPRDAAKPSSGGLKQARMRFA